MLPMMSLLVYHLGQNNDTCTSSAMPGIGLGPPVAIIQKRSNTWQDCRDLCCKNDACVAWTLLKAERICFLRNQLGTHVLESKNQISGVTKGYVLPSPRRKELRFYVGILSAAKNRARVHMLTVPAWPDASCFWQRAVLSSYTICSSIRTIFLTNICQPYVFTNFGHVFLFLQRDKIRKLCFPKLQRLDLDSNLLVSCYRRWTRLETSLRLYKCVVHCIQ